MVSLILENYETEVDFCQGNFNNDTPLHEACRSGNVEVLKKLIKHIPQKLVIELKAQKNKADMTLMHIASLEGHFEVIKFILQDTEDRHSLANAKDCRQRTPLHFACESGEENIVDLLINNGASSSSDKHGTYPMHIAAHFGYENAATKLQDLENLVEINVKDKFHQTPLHYASRYNRVGMIQWLLKK